MTPWNALSHSRMWPYIILKALAPNVLPKEDSTRSVWRSLWGEGGSRGPWFRLPLVYGGPWFRLPLVYGFFHQLGKERWKRCHAYCRQTKVTYEKKSLLSPDKVDLWIPPIFHGSATCRRRHPFRALSMSRPLQHMQNLKPIFILFRPWGIGQGRKIKNSVFLVMIIGTFCVNIEGNLKTGFGVQPRKISLGTMAPLGRKEKYIHTSYLYIYIYIYRSLCTYIYIYIYTACLHTCVLPRVYYASIGFPRVPVQYPYSTR